MPIYEYQCQACGHRFDKLQKIDDPVLSECPSCSKQELRKLVSAPSFKLKGSGWYETDFKKSASNEKTDQAAPAKTTDTTESKSTTKETNKDNKSDA